jgi:hypothetical protein
VLRGVDENELLADAGETSRRRPNSALMADDEKKIRALFNNK